jgi:hypothetical protein
MSDVIKLVQGDTLPTITITLTDEVTGSAFSLAGATIAVVFRAAGGTTVLATMTGTIVDAPNGVFTFNFAPTVLTDTAAGMYEGEIKVTTAGGLQTVFEPLKFRVRSKF